MRPRTLGVMLVILVLFTLPIPQAIFPHSAFSERAEAQNPITDLAATGAAAVGQGGIQLINTVIDTLANAGGLLATVISVGLSLLNSFITFIISLIISSIAAIVSTCITICAPIISIGSSIVSMIVSGIAAAISGIGAIISGIVEILDVLQATGRGIDALCTGVGGLIIVLIADILLTIWQMIGYIAMIIWFGVKLVVGGILGIVGTIAMAIPIVSMVAGILGSILYAVWWVVAIVIGWIGIFLPVGLNMIISGGIGAWSNLGWYFTGLHLLDFVPTMLLYFTMLGTTAAMGMVGFGSASWIGGLGGGFVWVGDALIQSFCVLILWIIVAIISLVLFALRLYNILPMVYRFCLDTICT